MAETEAIRLCFPQSPSFAPADLTFQSLVDAMAISGDFYRAHGGASSAGTRPVPGRLGLQLPGLESSFYMHVKLYRSDASRGTGRPHALVTGAVDHISGCFVMNAFFPDTGDNRTLAVSPHEARQVLDCIQGGPAWAALEEADAEAAEADESYEKDELSTGDWARSAPLLAQRLELTEYEPGRRLFGETVDQGNAPRSDAWTAPAYAPHLTRDAVARIHESAAFAATLDCVRTHVLGDA